MSHAVFLSIAWRGQQGSTLILMSFTSVLYNLFLLLVSWGLITGAYAISKHYVLTKDPNPQNSFQKIFMYIIGAAICLFVCLVIWSGEHQILTTKGAAMAIATSASSVIGMSRAYFIGKQSIDNKRKDEIFNEWLRAKNNEEQETSKEDYIRSL